MINEERFWETSIAEAVSDRTPPDVTARVFAELAGEVQAPETRKRPRLSRLALELVAVAAVVVAIGLATGILKLPGKDADGGELLPPKEVAAAPGAEYAYKEGIFELKSGWMLVTTGAPTVVCEGSELTKVDGRVLIHAGSMPPGERPEPVNNWLNANSVETDMVNNFKHWVKGVGLAALVLSGSAILDGQEVKAPEPEPQSTAEWHVVRSVMDIDNLPAGAKYVNADGESAALLDFLAEVESIEAISLRGAIGIRPDHLESLKALKSLKWLDIRGALWEPQADDTFDASTDLSIAALEAMPALTRVGADLIPVVLGIQQDDVPLDATLPVLTRLSAKGVAIELGSWNPDSLELLGRVLKQLPTLSGIEISYATKGEMKLLAAHENLRRLRLTDYSAGDIGLAYVARNITLDELSLHASNITLDEIHQVSRMSSLRLLHLNGELAGSPDRCFETLAGMKQLRELELVNLELNEDALPAFARFAGREPLDRLRVVHDVLVAGAEGMDLMLAQQIPTRRLEVGDYWPHFESLSDLSSVDESLRKGDAATQLTVLCLEDGKTFDAGDLETSHADLFKAYPNLKRIEIRRGAFEVPVMEDQFVRWLKESLPDVEVVVTP
ncbi:MAG: hypothetical protein K8I27_10405 [Planctomycetes bacterium]|nr:hypothetical protein [Planctomycetota bacterium]